MVWLLDKEAEQVNLMTQFIEEKPNFIDDNVRMHRNAYLNYFSQW